MPSFARMWAEAMNELEELKATKPGLSDKARAFLEGKIAAFKAAGLPEKAAEVERDREVVEAMALRLGAVIDWTVPA